MKKFLILVLVVITLSLPHAGLHAATSINIKTASETPLFGLDLGGIYKIKNSDLAKFNFDIVNIQNESLIDHWKIRVWCEGDIQIKYDLVNMDLCGKVARLEPDVVKENFSLFLTDAGTGTIQFSFKLKAYDKEGRWIHSEREAFIW